MVLEKPKRVGLFKLWNKALPLINGCELSHFLYTLLYARAFSMQHKT